MNLKLIYLSCAAGIAIYTLLTVFAPQLLVVLIDPVSITVNLANIRIALYGFAIWAVVVLLWLARIRPELQDWPAPRPLWLGVVWLVLCVSYTGFEHGWFVFADIVYAEDGVFETATAVILLVCSVVLFASLGCSWALDRRLGAAVAFMSVLCFLLLMEELSWGQRIFGFETPDEIENINAQQETNLHNMFVGFNQLIRLVVALLIATVLLGRDRWSIWLRSAGLDRLMPPPAAVYFTIFLIYAHTYDELFEEVVGLFLLVYVFDLRRRLIRDG
ncbi:MAG: hypothetical protein ABJ215_00210 [Alphaproteobacteria bacterium]